MKVIGIGEKKTQFFYSSLWFIYIEVLDGAIQKKSKKRSADTKNQLENPLKRLKTYWNHLNKIDTQTIELIEVP
jgi:hypothetical protein